MVEKHDEYERQYNAAATAFHNAFMDKLDSMANTERFDKVESSK